MAKKSKHENCENKQNKAACDSCGCRHGKQNKQEEHACSDLKTTGRRPSEQEYR